MQKLLSFHKRKCKNGILKIILYQIYIIGSFIFSKATVTTSVTTITKIIATTTIAPTKTAIERPTANATETQRQRQH